MGKRGRADRRWRIKYLDVAALIRSQLVTLVTMASLNYRTAHMARRSEDKNSLSAYRTSLGSKLIPK